MVVLCFHSPIDAHTKFEANPPSFFAVYDGHNGDFASEVAKSKVMWTHLVVAVVDKCFLSSWNLLFLQEGLAYMNVLG